MNYNKILLVGLVVATAIFASLTIYISLREKTGKPTPTPSVTSLPTPAPYNPEAYGSENFDLCQFDKTKDRLIRYINNKEGKVYFSMGGMITYAKTQDGKTSLLIVSPDGLQAYRFTVDSNKKIVWGKPDSNLAVEVSNIKTPPPVSTIIYGSCDPQEVDKKLQINQINAY